MRKCMVEFLRKFENRAIKSGQANSIPITQIYKFTVIYFNFVRCWGLKMLPSLMLSPLIEKSMLHSLDNIKPKLLTFVACNCSEMNGNISLSKFWANIFKNNRTYINKR